MYRPGKHLMICFRIRTKAVTPMEAVILSLHFFFQNSFFICFSFVIPFLIMFIFFHSAFYHDIIGCQNFSAINTPIAKAVAKMKITRNLLYITKLSREFLICPLRKILTMKKLSLNTNTVRMLVLNMFRDIFSLNLFRTI